MNNCDLKELVDLFAKLVIAVFSFIGPSFTLFIALFSGQLQKADEEFNSRLSNLNLAAGARQIDKIKLEIDKIEKERKRQNPMVHIKRIFGALLLSICCIAFFYFQHSHYWSYKDWWWLRWGTIFASILLFLYSLYAFWALFIIIIDAKKEEEAEKRRILNGLQTT